MHPPTKTLHVSLPCHTYIPHRHLKYLFEKPALTSRISHWLLLLSEFDVKYVTSKSVKGRTIAEHLAEHPIDSEEDREFPFPDESIMEVVEDQ